MDPSAQTANKGIDVAGDSRIPILCGPLMHTIGGGLFPTSGRGDRPIDNT